MSLTPRPADGAHRPSKHRKQAMSALMAIALVAALTACTVQATASPPAPGPTATGHSPVASPTPVPSPQSSSPTPRPSPTSSFTGVPLSKIDWKNGTFPLECFNSPTPLLLKLHNGEATRGDFHYYVDPPVYVGLTPYSQRNNDLGNINYVKAAVVVAGCGSADSSTASVLVFADSGRGTRFIGYAVTLADNLEIAQSDIGNDDGSLEFTASGYSEYAPHCCSDLDVFLSLSLNANGNLSLNGYRVSGKPGTSSAATSDTIATRGFACSTAQQNVQALGTLESSIVDLTGKAADDMPLSPQGSYVDHLSKTTILQMRILQSVSELQVWNKDCYG